jgi:hypothetical protein
MKKRWLVAAALWPVLTGAASAQNRRVELVKR